MEDQKRTRRALVIGSRGQDGRIMSQILLNNGIEVIGVIRKNSKLKHPSIQINEFEVDLSDIKTFNQLLDTLKPNHIFHFGAIHANSKEMAHLELNQSDEMFNCHVKITQNILNWQTLNPSTSLIALSSFIYTPRYPRHEINLGEPYAPQNQYGRTKMAALNLITDYREKFGVKSAGLILFNHSSEYAKAGFLIPNIASNLFNAYRFGKKLLIKNSEQLVDISNAYDFCHGFYNIIERDCYEDFIFSSGNLRSIRSIYSEAIDRLDRSLNSLIEFDNLDMQLPSMFGNVDKTRSRLDWQGGGDCVEIIERIFRTQINESL